MCTKLKAILMAIILAGFASQQAAAENLSDEDMAFAFGDATAAESAEMDLLSNEEMMATEGGMLFVFLNEPQYRKWADGAWRWNG